MARRLATLTLLMALVLPALGISARSGDLIQDILVAPDGSHYPIYAFDSIRRPNVLIVYTPDYGSATGTVDAVIEMVVVNDHVTEIRPFGYNNTRIPDDGYVVSAHGASATWLRTFKVGDPVEIQRNAVVGNVVTIAYPVHQVGPNVRRGADQLVVFTPGMAQTGTNPWGIEAVVRENVVIAVGGNDSIIPEDGFVLSAHGVARDWLVAHVPIGAFVEIVDSEIVVASDSRSLQRRATTFLEQASLRLAEGEALGLDLAFSEVKARQSAARDHLKMAEAWRTAGDERAALQSAAAALDEAERAAWASHPSAAVGLRGAWYRQVELTPDHVVATLDRLVNAGVNVLFLETFYRGRTLYPSNIALQHTDFRRWDPLAVWVEEANKRGIDLHLWVHVFRFDECPNCPILSEHPEWLASGPQTDVPSHLRANRASVDPAHPEAQAFLLELFEEMITQYDVVGLHLDYIRYPKSDVDPSRFTVTDYSRQRFMEETGIDPLQWVNRTNEPEWLRWQEWQEAQVNEFVAAVSELTKRVRPDLVLSAAVIGEIHEARSVTRQNWPVWADHGYVKLLFPMLYNPDAAWVGRAVAAARQWTDGKALITAGLGPYLGFSPELLVEQVREAEAAGSFGAAHYALSSLEGPHFAALRPGLYHRPAVPPYRTAEAIRALANDLLFSLERTGGLPHVWEAAHLLLAYGAQSGSEMTLQELFNSLEVVIAAGSNEESTPSEQWQKTLLDQAREIITVALHQS